MNSANNLNTKGKNLFPQVLKQQLKFYLKSPVFYISAVIFAGFIYINYFTKLQSAAINTQSNLLFFSSIPYICILVIPSLCFKPNFLVYNDFLPFSRKQKVLCNFLYILICYLILLVLLFPGVIISSAKGNVSIDGGQIFTSFLCLIIYGAALISLCLFINILFNSQLISFIAGVILLAVFNSSHLFSVYCKLPSFLSLICQKISFSWHFDAASKGIIDTRDFIFLIFSSFLFLFLCVLCSELKAGKNYSKSKKISNYLYSFLLLLIILNGNRWYKRIDFSKSKIYSISKYTKELSSKLNKSVKITYYRSSSLTKLYPQIRDISDYLLMYSSQNRNISLQIIDPDKKNLSSLLDQYGIYSQQLRSVKNNSTEFTNVYSAITLEYNGNTEVIPFIMSPNTLEYDLDGRLLHLVSQMDRVVNIIIGNGRSIAEDYTYIVPYLTSQGFICNPIFVDDPAFVEQLQKASGTLLIIGDSNIAIDRAIAIEDYILQQKGNALITASPFTANIEEDWSIHFSEKSNIIDMIENWGVIFDNEIVSDISCARITMYSQDDNSSNTQVLNYPQWITLMPQKNCKMGATMFWPVKLEAENPYFVTSSHAYTTEIDRTNNVSLIETNPFNLSNELPSTYNSYTIGAEIKGKLTGLYNDFSCEDSHIIVIPDQYFLHSLMNEYIGGEYGDYRNFDLLVNMLLKLNDENELAELQYR